jgi:hypothetical protein
MSRRNTYNVKGNLGRSIRLRFPCDYNAAQRGTGHLDVLLSHGLALQCRQLEAVMPRGVLGLDVTACGQGSATLPASICWWAPDATTGAPYNATSMPFKGMFRLHWWSTSMASQGTTCALCTIRTWQAICEDRDPPTTRLASRRMSRYSSRVMMSNMSLSAAAALTFSCSKRVGRRLPHCALTFYGHNRRQSVAHMTGRARTRAGEPSGS